MLDQQVKVKCRACNSENNLIDRICQKCGFSLTMPELANDESIVLCPRCQKVNTTGSFFCYHCGKYFADVEESKTGQKAKKPGQLKRQRAAKRAKMEMPGGSEIMLIGDPVFIERSDFDSTLPHDVLMSISRQHVLITYNRGRYYLKDYGRQGKGSTNHTRLNGTDIYHKGNKALKDGDKIELSGQPELTMTFRLLQESE